MIIDALFLNFAPNIDFGCSIYNLLDEAVVMSTVELRYIAMVGVQTTETTIRKIMSLG